MPGTDFDIYQTEAGYTAVTNEVRRVILNALAKKDRQLPELVKITKKAKPTLSSVHMKELLAAKLVEELEHPTDKRKKIYRLKARRIGSSSVPVDQLRSAVKHYVSVSPLAARMPLSVAFDAIAAAPANASDATLRAQARRLGALSASLFTSGAPRELVTNLAAFLEREAIARPLKIDLETPALEMELGAGFPVEIDDPRATLLVAGFVEGVLAPRGDVHAKAQGARRFHLELPPLEKA